MGCSSKKAEALYFQLLSELGNEFHILLEAPLNEIAARSTATLAAGIGRMRAGEVEIEAGYDGRFGTVSVSASEEDAT